MSAKFELPIHSLEVDSSSVFVKDLGYKNPYDFTKPHRHTYFELFLIETGGGLS